MAAEPDYYHPESKVEVYADCNVSFEEYDINVYKLIEEMKQRECLWNIDDPFYKNMEIRQNAWLELEQIFCRDSNFIKVIWKRIRDKLRYKITQELALNKELTPKFYNSWEYVEPLSFLHETIFNTVRKVKKTPKVSLSNVQKKAVKRKSNDNVITYSNKKKVKKEKLSMQTIIMKNEERLAKFQKNAETHIDADYLFLMSLLPTMKRLSDLSRMKLMIDIQKVLFNELEKVSNSNQE